MPEKLIDTTNVQDVFATTSILENAGGGCARIYNCVNKNGVLVPVGYSIVYPTTLLLKAVQGADEFTRRLVVAEMGGAAAH